ncbi:hypothetical protein [Arvimicrobium flavum]|uniref:hypothetical protein n=1 Tax=Arvimicrobium flavum TaxID=3393320 RepID=UPI00237A6138|nr:hypothetical protein [Mesorhizobium shangrilense]
MDHLSAAPSPNEDGRAPVGFFRSRWRGEVALGTLFWRDMAVVGTAINLATTLLALALLGLGFSLAVSLAAHLAPLPYNFFLFLAVWRTSDRAGGWVAQLAPLGAAAWLVVATLI